MCCAQRPTVPMLAIAVLVDACRSRRDGCGGRATRPSSTCKGAARANNRCIRAGSRSARFDRLRAGSASGNAQPARHCGHRRARRGHVERRALGDRGGVERTGKLGRRRLRAQRRRDRRRRVDVERVVRRRMRKAPLHPRRLRGFHGALSVQLAVLLAHDANGDACEAWLTEAYRFDLRVIRDRHREAYGRGPGEVVLLLDDTPSGRLVYAFE